MAQYKVPQDVEADDKLIGPFSFRQFIYLLIVAALIALAWALFQLFPLFAILPIPPAIFLLILALPLRKDQPMETYVAALISFYTKPNKRFWFPGQRESTVLITVPKVVEKSLTRDISEEEASHRLSFLADVVDSEGYSIKNGFTATNTSPVREEFIAEAEATPDIFDSYKSNQIETGLTSEADRHRTEIIQQMRNAIASNNPIKNEPLSTGPASNAPNPASNPVLSEAKATNATQIPQNQLPSNPAARTFANPVEPKKPPVDNRLLELSKNKAFSVATIAKEAHRKTNKARDGEIYISLH